MSNDCLILNGNGKPLSYFPLSAVDWKTAVKLVFTRNVIVIKEHEQLGSKIAITIFQSTKYCHAKKVLQIFKKS